MRSSARYRLSCPWRLLYCRRRYHPAARAVCLNNRQALQCLKKGRIMNPYKEEIIHAHAAIENWLSKGMGSFGGVDAVRC